MTAPSMHEVLCAMFDRLRNDASVVALVGGDPLRITSQMPQDGPLPACRLYIEGGNDWDTKTSDGATARFVLHYWTNDLNDGPLALMWDALHAATHNQPFSLSTGQSLLLRLEDYNTTTEPDAVSRHAIYGWRHIATT